MNHSDKATPFHLQGRLIQRRGQAVVRDETRHADAHSHDEAGRIAEALCGDGFTVWIWAVDAHSVPAGWNLIDCIKPPPHQAMSRRARDQHRARANPQGTAGRAGAVTA